MKRYVLAAHEKGWGHRIRVNNLGSALLSFASDSKVTVLVRRDDPAPTSNWTVLPCARSPFARTWAIITASVMVQDGFILLDWRVRLMRRLGGRLVLVVQPWGFTPSDKVLSGLEAADLILVPFPPRLYVPEPPLSKVTDKVRVIPPILSVVNLPRQPTPGRTVVYALVTRPPTGFATLLAEVRTRLERELGRRVDVEGGLGQLASREIHMKLMQTASAIITQGATSAFEAINLGIPTVLVPLREVPEQVMTARALWKDGLAEWVAPGSLTAEELTRKVIAALAIPSRGIEERRIESGTENAVAELRTIAGTPSARLSASGPRISIISTNYNCGHALERHLKSIYSQFSESEFDYVTVDNFSTDSSPEILDGWAAEHSNFRWKRRRCTMGRGREIAARSTTGPFLVVVDTDTIYRPILNSFVNRAIQAWPDHAVQAIYAGVFPRYLWRAVGGRQNFNSGEDFEMWMRLWKVRRIKWCPVWMGENIKETWARDSEDFRSPRYSRARRFIRLCRNEFDQLRLSRYDSWDLTNIWKSDSIDMGFSPVETAWFGGRPPLTLRERGVSLARRIWHLIQS